MMELNDILGSDFVELEAMLAEREHRAEIQQRLLDENELLLCVSMNMPGPVKDFPLLRLAFSEGCRVTREALTLAGVSVRCLDERGGPCGPSAFYRVEGNPKVIKTILCSVEDTPALGRLLDLDLIQKKGGKISRGAVGLTARSCLICKEAAAVCGRSRRHSVEQLQREAVQRMLNYFSDLFAEQVAVAAGRAMLYEVTTAPKPGLVDRLSRGAHRDMDIFTFLDSAAVLAPWFGRFCRLGLQNDTWEDERLFSAARQLGRQAEQAMFSATNGVNTHKGLIFSLGLLCTAAGQVYIRELIRGDMRVPGTAEICSRCAALATHSLGDFQIGGTGDSHGMRVFQLYHARGIRQEAADGFPSVTAYVMPSLDGDGSLEEKSLRALLKLYANLEDTNVLHRGGTKAMKDIAERADDILALSKNEFVQALTDFDQELTRAGLSPGGCADLLAVGLFLYFLNIKEHTL